MIELYLIVFILVLLACMIYMVRTSKVDVSKEDVKSKTISSDAGDEVEHLYHKD